MNLKNKIYTEIATGNTVRVLDNFEDIVILDNKEKVKSTRLLDKRFYEEFIDPTNFFSNPSIYDTLASKIKNINTEQLSDDDSVSESVVVSTDGNNQFRPASNESAAIYDDPEEEKRILEQRALEYARSTANSASNNANKQAALLAKYADEEAEGIVAPNFKVVEPVVSENKTSVTVNNVEQVQVSKTVIQPPSNQKEISTQVDPITQMFKNVKRNVDFNIKIQVDNKIPRLDFIEMMEDSYDISIIDFLADEFTEKILNDPSYIKEIIKKEISKMLSGNTKDKSPIIPKKQAAKKVEKKTPVNKQEDVK